MTLLRAPLAFILGVTLTALPLCAESVVAGLSRSDVEITARFDGSTILVFGAVRRETPIPEGPPLEVVITVQGPDRPVTVRRKQQRLGIWVNTDAVEIERAPSFYAIATTGPIAEVLSPEEDRRFRVTVPRALGPAAPRAPANATTEPAVGEGVVTSPPGARPSAGPSAEPSAEPSAGPSAGNAETQDFIDALIRIRTGTETYSVSEAGVAFEEATLFRTEFTLPANLTEGIYRSRIFLTRNGEVVDVLVKDIGVRKVGLERWLFRLSQRQPLIYGLLSVAMAVLAGWGASTAFRYMRR